MPAPLSTALRLAALSLLAVAGFGFAAACSGGEGSTAGVGASACGATGFCIVSCNLGCNSSSNICARTTIATNEPIRLTFSQPVDPATVSASTVSLLTPSGLSATGTLSLEDSGTTVVFTPDARIVAGQTLFGFESNQDYILSVPGRDAAVETLRSLSGRPLSRSLQCTLSATLGVIDLDGQPPRAVAITPAAGSTDVPVNTTIAVEFSELLDVSPFLGGTTATSPLLFRVRDTVLIDPMDESTRICDPSSSTTTIPGVPTVSVVDNRTVISLTPTVQLPPLTCVEIVVTQEVTDLSGRQAERQVLSFILGTSQAGVASIVEEFLSPSRLDAAISNATWSGGVASFSQIGGSGRHGAFSLDLGTTENGITTIDLDALTSVPAARTLFGQQDEPVVDATFEFTTMQVASNEIVEFVGATAPRILVRGDCTIDGIVRLNGEDNESVAFYSGFRPTGEEGTAGGPGGGRGGDGADPPDGTSMCQPNNTGQDGETLQVAPTSAFTTLPGFGALGGRGAPPFPADCLTMSAPVSIPLSSAVPTFARGALPAGASGGSFFGQGGVGMAIQSHSDLASDLGPDVPASPPISFLMPPPGVPSLEHFLIGGSGGGGGGASVFRRQMTDGIWTVGEGGTGGGGAIAFRVGGDFALGGTIEARGGDGALFDTASFNGTISGLGGAGSGGSVLVQALGSFTSSGVIDVRGGNGPRLDAPYTNNPSLNQTAAIAEGGDGSGGFVRLEQPNAPTPSTLGVVDGLPAAIQPTDTVGPLRDVDRDRAAGFVSRFYSTQQLRAPEYLGYVLTVRMDPSAPQMVFSDNPDFGMPLPAGGPITFFVQGAAVDIQTSQPIDGTLGPWVQRVFPDPAFVEPSVQAADNQGATGFRFAIQLDLNQAPDLVVERFEVIYRG